MQNFGGTEQISIKGTRYGQIRGVESYIRVYSCACTYSAHMFMRMHACNSKTIMISDMQGEQPAKEETE